MGKKPVREVALASMLGKALLLQHILIIGKNEAQCRRQGVSRQAVVQGNDTLWQETANLLTVLETRHELAGNSATAFLVLHSMSTGRLPMKFLKKTPNWMA